MNNFPKSLLENDLKDFQKRRKLFLQSRIYDGNSQDIKVIKDDKEALVISYNKIFQNKLVPCIVVFYGRRAKLDDWYRYNNQEELQNKLDKLEASFKVKQEYKERKKAIQQEGNSNVNIGDIFVSSWGYEQTNVNFYEVVGKVGKASLELREISQERIETGFMSGQCKPVRGKYVSESFKKRVNGNYIRFSSYQSASKVQIKNINGVEVMPSFYWSAYA